MMLCVLALACVMVMSVSGYKVTKAGIDSIREQTGAQNLAVEKVKYYPEIGANVLVVVALEGEKYRGIPISIPGTMPFEEPEDGRNLLGHPLPLPQPPQSCARSAAPAEGEYYTLSVSQTNPPRYTGSRPGETIVGGVTAQNSDGERVVIVAQFDSELNAAQLAAAASAVDTFLNSL